MRAADRSGFPTSTRMPCNSPPASGWPGWFESSLDLRTGLEVTESEPATPLRRADRLTEVRTSGPATRA